MLKFILLLVVTFLCPLFAKPVHASTEFSTSFASTYDIKSDTIAQVTHKIEIKNKLAHIYTKEYTITIGSNAISKLQVMTNGQIVPFERTDGQGMTMLVINIPNPAIGKDQILRINISYETTDLVEHYGRVWEVNIPKLLKANEAETYTRKVIVPSSFGQPTIEYPQATSTSNDDGGNTIFDYHGYPNDSITLLFGNHVDYQLDLNYEINNPTVSAAETEIALPPDTEYQRIILAKIDPAPIKIKTDADGNWLAIYSLRSQESKKIKATLYASVYPYAYYASQTDASSSLTKENKFWETKSDNVKSLANTLKTPLNIYSYLTENFTYDYQRVNKGAERLGASAAIAQPTSAICTEFTDSFVALARSAGIPSREIEGYAHTVNSTKKPGSSEDTLHAWPEYYDSEKKSWIQVDPTWGSTTEGVDYFHKLDFGHIAFVRHGVESDYPYPAGAYKNSSNEKSISVTIASDLPESKTTTNIEQVDGGYLVKNTGNTALVDYDLKLPNGSSYKIKYLPPYAETNVDSRVGRLSLWQRLISYLKSIL